jgi:hypothetical protein
MRVFLGAGLVFAAAAIDTNPAEIVEQPGYAGYCVLLVLCCSVCSVIYGEYHLDSCNAHAGSSRTPTATWCPTVAAHHRHPANPPSHGTLTHVFQGWVVSALRAVIVHGWQLLDARHALRVRFDEAHAALAGKVPRGELATVVRTLKSSTVRLE